MRRRRALSGSITANSTCGGAGAPEAALQPRPGYAGRTSAAAGRGRSFDGAQPAHPRQEDEQEAVLACVEASPLRPRRASADTGTGRVRAQAAAAAATPGLAAAHAPPHTTRVNDAPLRADACPCSHASTTAASVSVTGAAGAAASAAAPTSASSGCGGRGREHSQAHVAASASGSSRAATGSGVNVTVGTPPSGPAAQGLSCRGGSPGAAPVWAARGCEDTVPPSSSSSSSPAP